MENGSGGERWGSTPYTAWENGIFSQRVGWGSVDGRFLEGNIRTRGGFWLNPPNRIFAEGDHLRGGGRGTQPGINGLLWVWLISH